MKAFCPRCQAERIVPFRPGPQDAHCPECATRLVSSLNRERKPIERKSKPKRSRVISPASEEQREKARVAGYCLACGVEGSVYVRIDPSHVVDRSLGGCDDELCTVPLCRRCHRAYDDHKIDLLPKLEPNYRDELAHAIGHLGLLATLERVTGLHWQPATEAGAVEVPA